MKHIKSYKIFESGTETKFANVDSLDEFKKSFEKEFKNGQGWSEKFGIWDKYFKNGTFEESKYLVCDGEIVGGFLIYHSDMSTYCDHIRNSETTSDIKIHRNPDDFRDESGIYLEYIFVKPEWRNQGLGKLMISHIENLGYDYMWEMSVEKKASGYWIDKIKRDVLMEYEDSTESFGRTFVTYKILDKKILEIKKNKWNQFKDMFIKIDEDEYDDIKEKWRDRKEQITRWELKWLSDNDLIVDKYNDILGRETFNYLTFSKWGYRLSLSKYDDGWFLVRTGKKSETTTADFGFRKYFKCDQFDGLKSLVREWIKVRGNLKSK